jgi:hypothetical protein
MSNFQLKTIAIFTGVMLIGRLIYKYVKLLLKNTNNKVGNYLYKIDVKHKFVTHSSFTKPVPYKPPNGIASFCVVTLIGTNDKGNLYEHDWKLYSDGRFSLSELKKVEKEIKKLY